ncbi:DUF2637 domain-containing protein [Dactylosporangium sp. CS-033363]|uniref:DUF2637 domain-containing protein n=1 Tax=Dactylosporangium sp. CS-033363 TaxID=3239935 RepID=UPI003D918610
MNGRTWAYIGTIFGGVASLAANVAHCYVAPVGAPLGWSPEVGAVATAMFWPIALFVAVEILIRTEWPAGKWWWLARYGGVLIVAAVAAVVSYRHLSALIRHYGEDGLTSMFGPAAVDGLMVMAATALLASSDHKPSSPDAVADPEPLPVKEIHVIAPAPRINGAIPSGVVR